MSNRMPRREFIGYGSRTALGLSLLPLAACSSPPPATTAPQAGVPLDLTAALESQIPPLMAALHVPGLSIALVANAEPVWSRGFGTTHAGSATPVDGDTRFEAGSVSKTVFAYAVMKLSEKGVLDLDRPLVSYTSERWIVNDSRFNQITARHVLSHTSGLQNWRSKEDPLRIHFDPGTKWFYSGEGYSFLQLVVAHLTGRVNEHSCETMYDGLRVCATEIDAYFKANLLKPLGMMSSGYEWDEALAARTAGPHDKDGKPLDRPRVTPISAARFGAAGNLITTANDYGRFMIEVLQPGPHDDYRLSLATRDEMIRPQVKVDDSSWWALGWLVQQGKNGTTLSHSGDNPGYKSFMLASVERKSGCVMLTNSDSGFEVIAKLVNGDTPLSTFIKGLDDGAKG